MTQLTTSLAAALLATLVALTSGPIPELATILQLSGIGGIIGLGIALRAQHHGAGTERRWTIIARWTLSFAVLGVLATAIVDLAH